MTPACQGITQQGRQCSRLPYASTREYLELSAVTAVPIDPTRCKQHSARADLEAVGAALEAWKFDELPLPLEEPACWSWLEPVDPTGDDPWAAVVRWQAGRCALCGDHGKPMVRDHNHWTGRCRGQLCRGCNIHEGSCWRSSCRCAQYRSRPPVAVVGVEVEYTGGWSPAISRIDDPEGDAARVAAVRGRARPL